MLGKGKARLLDITLLSLDKTLYLIGLIRERSSARNQPPDIELWDLSEDTANGASGSASKAKKVRLLSWGRDWKSPERSLTLRYVSDSQQFVVWRDRLAFCSPPSPHSNAVMLFRSAQDRQGMLLSQSGAASGQQRGFSTFTAGARTYLVVPRSGGRVDICGPEDPQTPLCTYEGKEGDGKPYFLRSSEACGKRYLVALVPNTSTNRSEIRIYGDPLAEKPNTKPLCRVGRESRPGAPLYNTKSGACLFTFANKLYLATITRDGAKGRVDWYRVPSGKHLGTRQVSRWKEKNRGLLSTKPAGHIEAFNEDGLPRLVAFTAGKVLTIAFK